MFAQSNDSTIVASPKNTRTKTLVGNQNHHHYSLCNLEYSKMDLGIDILV